MFITVFLSNSDQRSPRASWWDWVSRPNRVNQWGSNQKPSNSGSMRCPTVPLTSRNISVDFVSSSSTTALTLFMMFYTDIAFKMQCQDDKVILGLTEKWLAFRGCFKVEECWFDNSCFSENWIYILKEQKMIFHEMMNVLLMMKVLLIVF